MSDIAFLGEDDFSASMNGENRRWRNDRVSQGSLRVSDGISLNYYKAVPENPKGAIVIVHGFCEFFGKYHEYAFYLYQSGFQIYFPEQRGFGYSGGRLKEWDLVYIDDYDTYVSDLKTFMDEVVVPETEGLERILLAHSMGGAVSTLFIEKYPAYFDRVILNSPMLKLKSEPPFLLRKLFAIWVGLTGKAKEPAPGQERFSEKPDFENSCCLSPARYDYVFEMRLKDEHYRTSTPTIGWALASFKTHKRIMDGASAIKMPVTVFTAGNDTLIADEGYRLFKERVKHAVFINFEGSKHELFNAADEDRIRYFKEVLRVLGEG